MLTLAFDQGKGNTANLQQKEKTVAIPSIFQKNK
jgi:hypothetical protein